MRPFVFSWSRLSKSAKMLKEVLKADFSYPDKGTAPKAGQVVINWGSSYEPPWAWQVGRYINKPSAVRNAVNKLRTFKLLQQQGLPIPQFTTSIIDGLRWIREGGVVYARTLLTAKRGDGCEVYHLKKRPQEVTMEDLEDVKLFTKGFVSTWEFKVHIINGKVDHVIRVSKDEDYLQDPYIRNHDNGWTFYDEKRDLHPEIKRVCVASVAALGLDFGVVDIGVGKGNGEMCIYEVNTAPGGEMEDARMYARAICKEFGVQKGV